MRFSIYTVNLMGFPLIIKPFAAKKIPNIAALLAKITIKTKEKSKIKLLLFSI